MSKYTLTKSGLQAHTMSGGRVIVPDEVAASQKEYDGKTFPALRVDQFGRVGKKCRVRLMGDAYGLHTAGTGDMVVSIV